MTGTALLVPRYWLLLANLSLIIKKLGAIVLDQAWANYGTRARCGPFAILIWPNYIYVYNYYLYI